MRSLRPLALAWLFAASVVVLCIRSSVANPTNCDNKCRTRQFFASTAGTAYVYYKYESATCEHCTGVARLCLPKTGEDPASDDECYVPAGKENANKYWVINSKTVCDHDPSKHVYVEAEAGSPADETKYTVAPLKNCRPKSGSGEPP